MTGYDFKKNVLPLLIKIGIGLGIGLLVVAVSYFLNIDFLKKVELLTLDYRYQTRYDRLAESGTLKDFSTAGDVVIIGISDQDSRAMPEPFPFPRSYYGHLVENLNRAGARVIAFDITFQDQREGDEVFREILRKYDNVVLAVKSEEQSTERAYVRSIERTYNNVFYDVNKRVGVVNIIKDRDDIARRYFPMMTIGDYLTPTFAFAVLNRHFQLDPTATPQLIDDFIVIGTAQGAYRVIPRFDDRSLLLNYYGPNKSIPYIDFAQAIDDAGFNTKDEIEIGEELNLFEGSEALFRNKIVLIGSTMPEERDYHSVPIKNPDGNTLMNGVEIHATAIQNILDQDYITVANPATEITVILVLSLLVFLGLLWLKSIKTRLTILVEIGAVLVVLLLIGGIFEFSVLMFTESNALFNIVNPSLAVVFCYFGTAVYQYLAERQQKALIKGVFSHYISAAVVNELVNNPEKAKLGGDRRELTVFFSDIAGFTTISEQFHNRPEGLVELLNEYLDEMTSIVLKYGGTLDKYEGDAIMAFWGAPIPQKDHALRTCVAALEMQKRLAALRPKWKKDGRPPLEVRCGINTGVMIVGNMGGKDRFDYTVIGDSVNLASRLEGANKQYGSNIMISDMTYQHVKDKVIVRELDLIQVKGKTEPVKVWELLGTSDMQMTPQQKEALEIYTQGLELYRARNWQEAIGYFNQAHTLDPQCHVATIYAQRAELYQLNPPPDDWNGVFVMTTK
ncbi:MAG: adenylate/guanylate cyclase domain-containing protein [Bacteroidia bacterium]|nr:MAG: adenylate/guanylate cyclase domain-containing protein [Bacteroidia bacterium]